MKNIKPYKLFESQTFEDIYDMKAEKIKEIYHTCLDILLELKDDNFKTKVNIYYEPIIYLSIEISKSEEFSINDVKDTIERLKEYLKEFNFLNVRKGYRHTPEALNVKSIIIRNPNDFSVSGYLFKLDLNFYLITNESKLFESKKHKPLVSDVKYELEDILLELKDEEFEYDIKINNWSMNYKNIDDNSEVNWLNLEIKKDGEWDLTHIDEYIIRVIVFLSSKGINPLFDPNPDINMKTAIKTPNTDKFKNMLGFIPALGKGMYKYDIQFESHN